MQNISYVGFERPTTSGVECLNLGALPTLSAAADADCEAAQELDIRLGGEERLAVYSVDSSRPVIFKGCWANEGRHRVGGHVQTTFEGCVQSARDQQNNFVALEGGAFPAIEDIWCLTFQVMPEMNQDTDAVCASEKTVNGLHMGTSARLAIYEVGPTTTTTTAVMYVLNYEGCFDNSGGSHQLQGSSNMVLSACEAAAGGRGFMGLQGPSGTPGESGCFTLDAVPSLASAADSSCEDGSHLGVRLGGASNVAVYAVDKSRPFVYLGCFVNNHPNRVEGHVSGQTIKNCFDRAFSQGKRIVAMEFPSRTTTQCLLLDELPAWVQDRDGGCENVVLDGVRMGGNAKVAVYQLDFSTETTTTDSTSTATSVTLTTSTSTGPRSETSTMSTSTLTSTTVETATSTTASSSTVSTSSITSSSSSSTTASSSTTSMSSSSSTSTLTSLTSSSSSSRSSSSSSSTSTSSSSSSSSSSSTRSSTSSISTTSSSSSSSSSSSTSSATSSTTTVTPSGDATKDLQVWVAAATENLRRELLAGSESQATRDFAWGKVAMTRPGFLANELVAARDVNASNISLRFPTEVGDLDTEIRLPTALLRNVTAEELAEMSVVVGMTQDANESSGGVEGRILIELQTSTAKLKVEGFEEVPIAFSLPARYRAELTCAYFDEVEERWSTEGVRLGLGSEESGQVWCESSHLSFFGAILKGLLNTLLCANFDMFSEEALREVFKGSWYKSLAATLCWGLYSGLAAIFLLAAFKDNQRQRRYTWRDDFFIVDEDDEAAEEVPTAPEVADAPEEASKGQQAAGLCAGCLAACGACMAESGGVRDAITDILSHWCHWIEHIRILAESMCAGISVTSLVCGRSCVLHLFRGSSMQMLHTSAQRMTSCQTGLTQDMVSFVLQDKDLIALLMGQHEAVARRRRAGLETAPTSNPSPGRNGQWKTAAEPANAWRLLHEEVHHHVLSHTHKGDETCLKAMLFILTAGNPLGEIFLHDVFISCKQRAMLFCVDLVGASFLSCLFYQASGPVSGKKNISAACSEGDDDNLAYQLGRILAVTIASVFFAEVPVILLQSLQTKGLKFVSGSSPEERSKKRARQLRAWALQERLFWLVGFMYVTFCTSFVILFLANIGNSDSEEWFTVGWLSLVEDLLALPVCVALLIPLTTRLLLMVYSRLARISTRQMTVLACEHLHHNTNLMLPIVQV